MKTCGGWRARTLGLMAILERDEDVRLERIRFSVGEVCRELDESEVL